MQSHQSSRFRSPAAQRPHLPRASSGWARAGAKAMAFWPLLNSGMLVRTGHTVLTWGITLVLFLHDTELRQWEEQGELFLPLTFLLLVLSSLLLYLAVSLMDPGYVTTQPQPQVTRDHEVQTPPQANGEERPQKYINVKP